MVRDRKSATTGSEDEEVETSASEAAAGESAAPTAKPAGEMPQAGEVAPAKEDPLPEVTVTYDGSRGPAVGVPVRDGAEIVYFVMGRPRPVSADLAARLVAAKKGFTFAETPAGAQ